MDHLLVLGDLLEGLGQEGELCLLRLFLVLLLVLILNFLLIILLFSLLSVIPHLPLLINLINRLIIPQTPLLLVLVPDLGAIQHVLLELGLINEHPLLIRTLNLILQIAAMRGTVFGPFGG